MAEHRPLPPRQRLSRRPDDDDLRAAPLRLLHDRDARAAGPHEPVEHADAVGVSDRDRLVELPVRRVLQLVMPVSSGLSSGTSRTLSATIRAPRSAARLHATSSASSEGWPATIGHEEPPVLERERGPERGRRLDRARRATPSRSAAGRRRRTASPESDPAEPDPARGRVLEHDHEERGAGGDTADDREERPFDPAETEVRPRRGRRRPATPSAASAAGRARRGRR